jgi:hypothetical protein
MYAINGLRRNAREQRALLAVFRHYLGALIAEKHQMSSAEDLVE